MNLIPLFEGQYVTQVVLRIGSDDGIYEIVQDLNALRWSPCIMVDGTLRRDRSVWRDIEP